MKSRESHFEKEERYDVKGFNGFSNNVKVSYFDKDS